MALCKQEVQWRLERWKTKVSFAMRGDGNKCHQVGNIRALFPETGGSSSRQKNHNNYIAQKLTAHINLVHEAPAHGFAFQIAFWQHCFWELESPLSVQRFQVNCAPAKGNYYQTFFLLCLFFCLGNIDPTVYLVNSQPQGRRKSDDVWLGVSLLPVAIVCVISLCSIPDKYHLNRGLCHKPQKSSAQAISKLLNGSPQSPGFKTSLEIIPASESIYENAFKICHAEGRDWPVSGKSSVSQRECWRDRKES